MCTPSHVSFSAHPPDDPPDGLRKAGVVVQQKMEIVLLCKFFLLPAFEYLMVAQRMVATKGKYKAKSLQVIRIFILNCNIPWYDFKITSWFICTLFPELRMADGT